MKSIHALLEVALAHRASDLIIKAGAPPTLRVDGRIVPTNLPPMTPEETRECGYSIIYSASRDYLLQNTGNGEGSIENELFDAEARLQKLHTNTELDLVFTIRDLARIRANLFLERGMIAAALRIIPLHPLTIDELGLPPVLKDVALQPQGLIIITGPTGSGKTTTLAAILEEINRKRPCNIFTIEEPIEYVFTDKKSVIHQREVGLDTQSFATGLRSVLRQSPDVIAIGELRDAETMDVAMTASEIGHLVVTTLHTVSATATVDRIINSFPLHMRDQIAAQLAASLLCITSQRLVHCASGSGRLPAVEVMTNSPTVRKQIEEGETGDLYASIREGQHYGMNTMNQALERLYQRGLITYEEAMRNAGNPAELKQMLRRV